MSFNNSIKVKNKNIQHQPNLFTMTMVGSLSNTCITLSTNHQLLIYCASAPCKCTIATVLQRQLLVRQDIIGYNAIFDNIHFYSIDQQARPNSPVQQQDIAQP